MARVLVDGEEHGTFTSHVDTEQNKPAQVIAYQVTDLAEGEHTVVVEALGEAAPGGEGTVVSLDAFDVPAEGGEDGVGIPGGVWGWPRWRQAAEPRRHRTEQARASHRRPGHRSGRGRAHRRGRSPRRGRPRW